MWGGGDEGAHYWTAVYSIPTDCVHSKVIVSNRRQDKAGDAKEDASEWQENNNSLRFVKCYKVDLSG